MLNEKTMSWNTYCVKVEVKLRCLQPKIIHAQNKHRNQRRLLRLDPRRKSNFPKWLKIINMPFIEKVLEETNSPELLWIARDVGFTW